jgi:integrase
MSELLLDAAGRRRSPETLPECHAGRPPRHKGMRYPADPPTIEEIVTVMRRAGDGVHGRRLRGLIVVLWRAGLRIHEALALPRLTWMRAAGRCWCGAARAVAAARSAWTTARGSSLSPGSRREWRCRSIRCSASSTAPRAGARGRPPPPRSELRRVARQPGVRRRFAPHQLRHAHAVETARERVPLIVIQRQLGHTNLGITSIYLQGIDNAEITDTVHARRAPMVAVHSSLRV